jgi:hypothetical protein
MTTNKEFPNGFTSWVETFYEIVSALTSIESGDGESEVINEIRNTKGIGGMYEFAEVLTDEFELTYKDEDWSELGFFETLENFVDSKTL